MTKRADVLRSIDNECKTVKTDIETCQYTKANLPDIAISLLAVYNSRYNLKKETLDEMIAYLKSMLVELERAKKDIDKFAAMKSLQ